MRKERYGSVLAQILAVLGTGACGGNSEEAKSTTSTPHDAGQGGAGGGFDGSAGTGGAGGVAGQAGTGSQPDAAPSCLDHRITERYAFDDVAGLVDRACGADRFSSEHWDYVCFAPPADGSSCTATYDTDCVRGAYYCGLLTRGDVLCGPQPPVEGLGVPADACCYVLFTSSCPVGRPFIVHGRARHAPCAEGEGWRVPVSPDTSALDAATRRALADLYRQDAQNEHASVASFARFVLQCLALGAPAEIVLDAQRAGLEEVEHARLSFGLASAYSGRAERALALDVSSALDGALDARAVAIDVAREGCIAETVSALLIAAARDQAEDPAVRRVLGAVAEQELRHAQLAWRYLAWALEQGDRELRRAVAQAFARAESAVGLGPETAFAADVGALRAHGWLPIAERRAIALEALREVVLPAAKVLLATYSAVDRPGAASAPEQLDPAAEHG